MVEISTMDTVEVQQISLLVGPQALNLEGTQALNIIRPNHEVSWPRRGSRRDDESYAEWPADSADSSFLYLHRSLNLHRLFSDRSADDTWRSVRHPDRSHPRSPKNFHD